MVAEAELLRVIDLLYEAALTGAWGGAVRAVADGLGAEAGAIAVHDLRSLSPLQTAWVAVDQRYQQMYAEVYMQPDMAAVAAKVVADARSFEVVTEEFQAAYPETYRTRFYNEFVRPQRMHRQLLAQGAPWPNGWAVLFLSRSIANSAFDSSAEPAMRLLQPHLLRAVQVRRRLDGVGLERQQALDALDRLEHGVLLVDAQGHLRHASRAAEAMLGDGLLTSAGTLACDHADDTRALRRSVGQAAAAEAEAPGAMLAIRRRSGRRPLSVLVAALPHGDPWLQGPPASAIVIVTDPERARPAGEAELGRLYGLTPAEARTALALLDAGGLAEVAERMSVSLATVRTLLQRAFEKTGTHRQAELVRLLMAYRLPGG